jgi:Polysaccharide lyase
LAIRFVSGKLYITSQTDSTVKTLFQTTEEIRNKWLDFRFKVRFSRLEDGFVEAWLNEKQIISYKGVTSYSSKRGYGNSSRFYFKTGLYRDLMTIPMAIYIDEYLKKELAEDK